jgi:hypothetical protein
VLRVLRVILGGNSIVIPRRFLGKREIALVYLVGVASYALAGALAVKALRALWRSTARLRRPVVAEAVPGSMIWS